MTLRVTHLDAVRVFFCCESASWSLFEDFRIDIGTPHDPTGRRLNGEGVIDPRTPLTLGPERHRCLGDADGSGQSRLAPHGLYRPFNNKSYIHVGSIRMKRTIRQGTIVDRGYFSDGLNTISITNVKASAPP